MILSQWEENLFKLLLKTKMKKLSITLMVLLISVIGINTYADDLSDLDALLNDNTTTTTWDTAATWDTTQAVETGTTIQKVDLALSGVTDSSVTLLLTPVDGYTSYKIYYSKDWDNQLSEKDLTYTWAGEANVTITGLNAETKYNFVAKAFDNEGNPVEATTSDNLAVTIKAKQHAAPADNVIYNPVVKVNWSKIIVSYKPGVDVKKVQISISEDGKTFKPVSTVDSSVKSYTITADKTGKKYIKLVPIAEDGTLWVCKIWATQVPFVTAKVAPKKVAKKVMWKPQTGPETYILVILAILAYFAYAIKKQRT